MSTIQRKTDTTADCNLRLLVYNFTYVNSTTKLTEFSEGEADSETETVEVVLTERVQYLDAVVSCFAEHGLGSLCTAIDGDVAFDPEADPVRQSIEVHVRVTEDEVCLGDVLRHLGQGPSPVAGRYHSVVRVVDVDAQRTDCAERWVPVMCCSSVEGRSGSHQWLFLGYGAVNARQFMVGNV